jgi:hypothetical protein
MQKTHMANLFGRHILLLCVAYVGGDPPPNQLILLNNTERTSNGIANTFSIGKPTLLMEARCVPASRISLQNSLISSEGTYSSLRLGGLAFLMVVACL